MADLDLTTGVEKGSSEARRTSSATREKKPSPSAEARKAAQQAEADFRTATGEMIDALADWRDNRGDDELAEALRDDAAVMTAGIVALTKNVKPLRGPAGLIVAIVRPILAFGKVGGILLRRLVERRQGGEVPVGDDSVPTGQ